MTNVKHNCKVQRISGCPGAYYVHPLYATKENFETLASGSGKFGRKYQINILAMLYCL